MSAIWIVLGYLVLVIAAPILIFRSARRVARAEWAGRTDSTLGIVATSIIFVLVLGPIVLFLLPSHRTPPGQDAMSLEFKQRSDSVLAALERYRHDHAAYPDSIEKLVPNYLDATRLAELRPSGPHRFYWLEYWRRMDDSTEFVLTFRFEGSGMSTCGYNYIGEGRHWSCSDAL